VTGRSGVAVPSAQTGYSRSHENQERQKANPHGPGSCGTAFVSLLSDSGVPVEGISRLVGHSGTTVTEEVYRKQIRPVIQTGAVAMDRIFNQGPKR
jgi:hypothetical protein